LRTASIMTAIYLLPLEKYSTIEEWIPKPAQTPQLALQFSSISRFFAPAKHEEMP
jgi:hypothetical protein